MRRTAVAFTALVLLCALAATSAWAGQSQAPTFFDKFKFEVSGGDGQFSGKIDSNKSKCVKGRKVTLYRKKSGDKKKLGSDQTSNKGKFKIDVGGNPKDGKYFAEAKQSSYRNNAGDKITCLDAKSAKVELS